MADPKYSAGPGWDPCTGLGSPNGPALFALAGGAAPPPPPAPPPAPPPLPPGLGAAEQLVLAAVNALFAALEARYALNPVILGVLKAAQAAVVKEIEQVFAQGGAQALAKKLLVLLMERLFSAAEERLADLPLLARLVEELRPLLEGKVLEELGL